MNPQQYPLEKNVISMKFDILKLHQPEDVTPRKWICAYGKNLNNIINKMILEIEEMNTEKIIYYKLSKKDRLRIYNIGIRKAGNQLKLSKMINIERQMLYRYREGKERIYGEPLERYKNFTKFNPKIIEERLVKRGFNRHKIIMWFSHELNCCIPIPSRIIYSNIEKIPLIFIIKLLKLWKDKTDKNDFDYQHKKNDILKAIEYLKQNTNKSYKVIALKKLTSNLARVNGALIADGTISKRCNSMSIVEGYKNSMEMLSCWIGEAFGKYPKVKECKNTRAWEIKIDNKIISRYFTVFLDYPRGRKPIDFDVSDTIKNSSFEIQKACAEGIMTFDGFVRIIGEKGINMKYRNIINWLYDVFKKDGILVSKTNRPDKTGMWRVYSRNSRNKKKHKKWMRYFFRNTEKWNKLRELIHGYSKKIKTKDEAIQILSETFPPTSKSKITLEMILKIFIENGDTKIPKIVSILKERNIHVVEETLPTYLSYLRDMNIIKKVRQTDNTNLYAVNELEDWRLPSREII